LIIISLFDVFVVCVVLLQLFFLYTVIITMIDECKHLHITVSHFRIFTFVIYVIFNVNMQAVYWR